MLNTMLVGEAVAGTVMSLVGSVSLSPLVDTGVSLSMGDSRICSRGFPGSFVVLGALAR